MPTWPDGVTLVTIRHTPVTTGGRILAGNLVSAVVSERVWGEEGSILPAEHSTTIQADGSWEIELPAVDSPGLRPQGVAYRLTEHVPGGRELWVAPLVHHAPGPVDLADVLTPAPSPGGGITIQTGPATDASMAEIAEDPDSEFHTSLSGVVTPIATTTAQAAASAYLASEPGVIDAAAQAASQAIADQGGIQDPVIAAALADPASASHQLVVPRGEVVVIDTDHPTLEAALAATAEGGTLEVRRQYTRTTPWTIDRPVTVRFARGGSVTTSTGVGITVAASGVTLDDPDLTGAGSAAGGSADAIRAIGTTSTPIDGLTINRPRLTGWPRCGIYAELVRGLRVTDVDIEDVGYAGVMALSVRGGYVRGGTVADVIQAAGQVNSYGIALTRNSSQPIASHPRTSDFTVEGVTIDGVPLWEGIDTHGGEHLRILSNTVRNCRVGIALVPCADETGTSTWAPQNVIVSGNTIESTVEDGSRAEGIGITGVTTELAAGILITGNRVIDHGNDSVLTSGGILLSLTRGIVITGNTIVRPAPIGICPNSGNAGAIIAGNTIEDVWTEAQAMATVVQLRSIDNTITISGTQITRGAKSAKSVNQRGLNASQQTGNEIVDGGGNAWGRVQYPHTGIAALLKSGFYGATPVAKPTGVTADAASIRAALIQLGLISA